MDNEIIQAYLWQKIIKLGFSPKNNAYGSWLSQYNKTLPDFWQTDQYPKISKDKNAYQIKIYFDQINLRFEFNITSIKKFGMRSYISDKFNLLWIYHTDHQYFAFPVQSILNKLGEEKQVIPETSAQHIEKVLDGLIFHPRTHYHIESPIDNHTIRIGGGLDNPFVFLFHLRYQLCPDKQTRKEEKGRLVTLFNSAIKNKTNNVTANDLLSGG